MVQNVLGYTALGYSLVFAANATGSIATALAQGRVPERAGAGSAVLGLLQFVLGGIASPLTGIAGQHSAVPMALSMAVCSELALAAALTARRVSR
ncbi:hypothetical protein [Arthrobacter mangrovi]|uniref:Major facilitator superfamily (MFS) profile domain-containing protein n=1 Tax=Arthrobacter mangrovi TaxID=2966350 RepID=A0ABQ5MS99_9MICC|nr:hypothetical protein [Arthrobacter mangrovi]GLB66838.1 hypothetical protein AHIS1636_12770 [Arthrobacter mangrovi]